PRPRPLTRFSVLWSLEREAPDRVHVVGADPGGRIVRRDAAAAAWRAVGREELAGLAVELRDQCGADARPDEPAAICDVTTVDRRARHPDRGLDDAVRPDPGDAAVAVVLDPDRVATDRQE